MQNTQMTTKAVCAVTSTDMALAIKAWWTEARFLTSGTYGEHNVFNSEPEFVTQAKQVLGDWEEQERLERGY